MHFVKSARYGVNGVVTGVGHRPTRWTPPSP